MIVKVTYDILVKGMTEDELKDNLLDIYIDMIRTQLLNSDLVMDIAIKELEYEENTYRKGHIG